MNGFPSPITVPATSYDYVTQDYRSGYSGAYECGHDALPSSCLLIQKLQIRAGNIILVPVFDPAATNKAPNNGKFALIGFAVFQLAPVTVGPTGDYVQNPKDTAHWYVLGRYLGSTSCQAPPSAVGPPADFGSTCYGTAAGNPSQSYGVGVLSLTE
jgi:hypothetical protein